MNENTSQKKNKKNNDEFILSCIKAYSKINLLNNTPFKMLYWS